MATKTLRLGLFNKKANTNPIKKKPSMTRAAVVKFKDNIINTKLKGMGIKKIVFFNNFLLIS